MWSITILDEGRRAHSSDGNYCLAIFRQQEIYDEMKTALSDICQEVENLSSIRVNDITFNIRVLSRRRLEVPCTHYR